MARIKNTVAGAAARITKEIAETANVYERIGRKIETFGVKVKIIKHLPLEIDIKIKDS